MTWSADEEYRTRVMSRRGTALKLRHPEVAYGPAALVLLYAVGLIAVLWAVTGFASIDGAGASALALPAGAATLFTALGVGGRLRRYRERSAGDMVVRVAMVWAFFGAAWPLLQFLTEILAHHGGGHDFTNLAGVFGPAGLRIAAGALVGAIGGVAGGAAATFLCVERTA